MPSRLEKLGHVVLQVRDIARVQQAERWTDFMPEPRRAGDAFRRHPLGITVDLEEEARLLGVA